MIVLSECSPKLPDSASLRDIDRSTEAAKISGWRVYHIPQDLPEGVSADDALWHIPVQSDWVTGIWVGYIPLSDHYGQVYHAALARKIRLVNNPEEFSRAEEFDKFYPLIADLTAESRVAADLAECEQAAREIGYPVFLKGTVQSLKGKGLGSCVAHELEELREIAEKVLANRRKSLGKVIVRQMLELRHSRVGPGEFPLGREFRVFVCLGQVVGMGYYWEGDDELAYLDRDEREKVIALALRAAERIGVPYLSVDLGQQVDGKWIVIEVGDGQFSGLSQTPIHELWARLAELHPEGRREK